MPSGIMPDNSLRFAFEGIWGECFWANVFHATVPDGVAAPTISELNTLTDALTEAFRATLLQGHPYIHQDVTHTRTKLKLIDGASTTYRVLRPAGNVGHDTGFPAAGQVCYLIDWQSVDPRRGGKPRTYLPGVSQDAIAGEATLTDAVVTGLSADANDFHDAVNGLSIQTHSLHMVEMSFFNAGAPRLIGVGYEIIGGNCSNVVATQRRRVDRLRFS